MKFIANLFYVGLILLACAILPAVYFTDLMFLYNEKRIIQAMLLVLGSLLFLTASKNRTKKLLETFPAYFVRGTIVVFLFALASAFFSPFPFYSIVEVGLWLLLCLVMLIVAHAFNSNKKAMQSVFAAACLLVLFYTIKFGLGYTFHLNGFQDFPLWPGRGFDYTLTGFSNVRFFNQVQVFTLPLIIGSSILIISKKKFIGYFLVFLSVVWWMLLIQSAGRGIILSVLTAALIILLLFNKDTHRWVWYFLGTLAVGYVSKLILFEVIPDPEQVKSIVRRGSGRLALWPKVFLDSLERPILGHGPMAFASLTTDYFRGHPHNSVLQLLYEFGYPVTMIFLAGVFYGIKQWIRQTKQHLQEGRLVNSTIIIRISLTAALFGGLLYSLFSGVIVMPISQLWLAVISGTIMGIYIRNKQPNQTKIIIIPKWSLYGIKILVLIAAGMLISLMIRDIPDLRDNESAYMKEIDSATLRPRFWQQGKIGLEKSGIIHDKAELSD